MKNFNHKLIYISLLLFAYSCVSSKSTQEIEVLSIGNATKLDDITDIFESVELIFLDTQVNAILSWADETYVINDTLYIKDDRQGTLFAFDPQGQLIFNTKKYRGRGPKEFQLLSDYTINPDTRNIEIFDPITSSLVTLGRSGEFISKVKLPKECYYCYGFEYLDKDHYLFFNTDRNFFLYNKTKNEVRQIPAPDTLGRMFQKIALVSADDHELHRTSNSDYYILRYNNLIYEIDSKKDPIFTVKYRLELTDNPLTPEVFDRFTREDTRAFSRGTESKKYSQFNRRFITDKYIYVAYLYKGQLHVYMYNRGNKKTICFESPLKSGNYINAADFFTDSIYYNLVPAYIFRSFPNYEFPPEIKERISNINDDDNLILVKSKFRKDFLQ